MNDGWDSEEDVTTVSAPVYTQTYSRAGGGGRRGDHENSLSGDRRGNYGGDGRGDRGSDRRGDHGKDWRGDNGGDRRGGGRGRGNQGNRDTTGNWRDSNSSSALNGSGDGLSIVVRTSNLGKIIGKGGCKIRELQESSGANIKVGTPCADDFGTSTEIVLSGSNDAKQKAKEMIEEINNPTPQPQNTNDYESSHQKSELIDWDTLNKAYNIAKKERWNTLPPLKKNFYHEDPYVTQMTPEEVSSFRTKNNNISVSYIFGDGSETVPNPVQTFEQCFNDYPEILSEIYKQKFSHPSPIQAQAWPVLLGGNDLIGIAQTGTGKTLAFLLPALIHIDGQPVPRSQRGGANVLVMAPTRELALQIEKEVRKYHYKDMKCVCVYGGGDRRQQINELSRGVEIIIATPGRLNDLVQAGIIDVTSVTYLVLDEADRMLDMGFEPQIRKTLLDIRPDRQTVMTSATWPAAVRRLAESYMKNPIQVFIGSLDLAAVHSVTQRIEFIEEENKSCRLREFLDNMTPDDKIIVFVGKKCRADDISSEMCLSGVNVQSIHGDREQCDREQALEDLKCGDVRILIATDVASRGIDIEDVTHIFNYDFPRNIEEYVHRVGRTGRAGKTGESISFFSRSDWAQAKELIPILEEANQDVPDELRSMAERYDAWKERRNNEKERERIDAGGGRGGGFRGGGRGRGGFGGGDRFGGGGGGGGFGGGGGGRRGGGRNKW